MNLKYKVKLDNFFQTNTVTYNKKEITSLPVELLLGTYTEYITPTTFYIHDKKKYRVLAIDASNIAEYSVTDKRMVYIDFKAMLGTTGVIYMIEQNDFYMYLHTPAKYKHIQHHRFKSIAMFHSKWTLDRYTKLNM